MDNKTDNTAAEKFELTSAQRFLGNVTAGALVVVCGLFLLLCGLGAINLKVSDVLLAGILFTIGFVLLGTGLIQKNTVSLWLSLAFIVPGIVEILARYTSLTYSNLYPLYIAVPALCSLFTLVYTREKSSHFYVIGLFAPISIIFSLKSSGLLSWSVVLPILIVFVGLAILLLAVKFKNADDGEDGDSQ